MTNHNTFTKHLLKDAEISIGMKVGASQKRVPGSMEVRQT